MVKIIDGEIYPDDHPVVRQRYAPPPNQAQRHAGTAAAGAAAAGAARAPAALPPEFGFDFNAPPVQLDTSGDGLPAVVIWGLRVPGVGVAGVIAATALWGLKGLACSCLFGWLYLRHNTLSPAAQPAPRGRAPGAGGSPRGGASTAQQRLHDAAAAFGLGSEQEQQPRRPGAPPGGGSAGGGPSGAFTGRSYKLGSGS